MTTFSEFNLIDEIQLALKEKKFLEPTPVQAKVIPQILENSQDIMALAQTGTGKTAAFGLPVLSKMDLKNRNVQAVILSPTRELAMQIADDLRSFSKYMGKVNIVTVYGGDPIYKQIKDIKRGAQVVVGTPGRTMDLLKRNVLKLGDVKWAILDEADEMLKMGFVEDLSMILGSTPDSKQTLLFSATMSKVIEKIARTYMKNPMRIEIQATPTNKLAITHQFMMVPARDRITAFQRYKELHPEMYGIVFCRTKRETQEVGDALLKVGYSTGVLHGDIEQKHRTHIMNAFKRKDTNLLVATDVAARGIDVAKLTHVIHFGVPEKIEGYVHRSGRTGRVNEKGTSIVFAHLREHRALKRIESINKIKFEEVKVPKRQDIIQADVDKYIKGFLEKTEESPLAKKYIDEILQHVSKDDMEKVARKALSYAIDERISRHPEEDLDRVKEKRPRGLSGRNENMKTLVISLGRKNRITVPLLLRMINDSTKGGRIDVGHIELGDTESSFEVPPNLVDRLSRSMSKRRFKGERITVKEGSSVQRSDQPRRRHRSGRPQHSGGSGGSNYSRGPQRSKRPQGGRRRAKRY